MVEALDGQLARQLARLRLQARIALATVARGERQRQGRGQSQAFAEHRAYVAGDPLRLIDWRASARRDKLQVKLYAHEARLTLDVVLDASASMGYVSLAAQAEGATAASRKWDESRTLAYALGVLALRRADAAGLLAWGEGRGRLLQPATYPGQARRLLAALAGLDAAGHDEACDSASAGGNGPTGPAAAAQWLGLRPRRRRVVVISDFLQAPQATAATLAAWVARGHQVDAVHVVHPEEVALPTGFVGTLTALESGGEKFVRDADDCRAFGRSAAAHVENVRRQLQAAGVHYHRHDVGSALATPLAAVARRG